MKTARSDTKGLTSFQTFCAAVATPRESQAISARDVTRLSLTSSGPSPLPCKAGNYISQDPLPTWFWLPRFLRTGAVRPGRLWGGSLSLRKHGSQVWWLFIAVSVAAPFWVLVARISVFSDSSFSTYSSTSGWSHHGQFPNASARQPYTFLDPSHVCKP